MRVTAIVQARMGSTRLPGKILRKLGDSTVLAQVVRRLRRCATIDEVVVATTNRTEDDIVVAAARCYDARWVRGSENDVLARYVAAVAEAPTDIVVRITSDCPLLDPGVVDRVVNQMLAHPCDYVSNTQRRTYPRGLDTEALHVDTLHRLNRLTRKPELREHVTAFVHRRPTLFLVRQVNARQDDSDLRWTVDTPADLTMVRTLYSQLDLDTATIAYADIVAHVRRNPRVAGINAHVHQKTISLAS